jgi:predicted amidophosphoribosyltransferase
MKLSLLGNIIDFLFPRYCAICDERLLGTEEMLCATCLQDLPITPTWERENL